MSNKTCYTYKVFTVARNTDNMSQYITLYRQALNAELESES